MKTNPLTSILLTAAMFAGLFPGGVIAEEQAAEEAKVTLAKLAGSKHDAVVRLEDATGFVIGAFISEDGLALVHVAGVSGEKKRKVIVAGNRELKIGKILGVFPEQRLALLKFDHRPATWIPLARQEPALGETIALLPRDRLDKRKKEIPPVVGPVMVKRVSMTTNLQVVRFVNTLSLGSGLLPSQRASLGMGCFAVDREGRLVAFLNSTEESGRQIQIHLSPVVALAGQIDQLTERAVDLGHPLPPEHDIIDRVESDPDYKRFHKAWDQRKWKDAQGLLAGLLRRHPTSQILMTNASNFNTSTSRENIEGMPLQLLPEPDPEAPVAQQVAVREVRAGTWTLREKFKEAAEELETAIALSPKDYTIPRVMLAQSRFEQGRLDEAEALCREVYPLESDSISFVERYEMVLIRQGKLKEAQKMTDRAFELEEIYRRPPLDFGRRR